MFLLQVQAPQELPSLCSCAVPASPVPRVGRRECWLPRAHRPRRDRAAPRRRHPLNRSCQLSVRLRCAIAVRCLLHFRSPRPAAARVSVARPQFGASPGVLHAVLSRIVARSRDRARFHGERILMLLVRVPGRRCESSALDRWLGSLCRSYGVLVRRADRKGDWVSSITVSPLRNTVRDRSARRGRWEHGPDADRPTRRPDTRATLRLPWPAPGPWVRRVPTPSDLRSLRGIVRNTCLKLLC
jgi:hypothetical protein